MNIIHWDFRLISTRGLLKRFACLLIVGNMKEKVECTLADGMNLWENIYAQFSFIALGLIGTVGIVLVDWRWVLPYLII